MKDKNYYRSLTRKLLPVMNVASFAPLVLISAIAGYRFETFCHEKVLALFFGKLAQKHRQNINGYLRAPNGDGLKESYSKGSSPDRFMNFLVSSGCKI